MPVQYQGEEWIMGNGKRFLKRGDWFYAGDGKFRVHVSQMRQKAAVLGGIKPARQYDELFVDMARKRDELAYVPDIAATQGFA